MKDDIGYRVVGTVTSVWGECRARAERGGWRKWPLGALGVCGRTSRGKLFARNGADQERVRGD